MSQEDIFNSRDSRFKSPYGAVASGTKVRFTLRPLRSEGYSSAKLIAYFEFDGNKRVEVSMPWCNTEYGRDEFTCELDTTGYVGLVWYLFELSRIDGRKRTLDTNQLTVYDGSERVPEWFGEGLCYQILPDRFNRTKIPNPAGLVGNRTVHEDWYEAPIYKPVGKNNIGKDICNRDFFGGNLEGVEAKLDYIASLGVETIYFCPIFEASENHRYGTADYSRIDPMLGTNEDFEHLCKEAHKRNIRIILDGVFNHTGYVSKYFNGDGFFGKNVGAFQSKKSPYYKWYMWEEYPKKYKSWWGIYSLPTIDKNCKEYRDFIFGDDNSVIRRWLKAGADGWRLDVADELADDFIEGLHCAVRETNPNGIVIGEVWEDGSTKVAYGVRRKHLLGKHLDGLMNYPFRNAVIDFLLYGNGNGFYNSMETLREHYPKFAFYSAMNSLGTHDTLRILTYLGTGSKHEEQSKEWRSKYQMTDRELANGISLLKLGFLILYSFPGAPTVYYGDEAGMTGYEDPFNRYGYPWGRENKDLLSYCKTLGHIRKTSNALRKGDIKWGTCGEKVISFTRTYYSESMAIAVNSGFSKQVLQIPWKYKTATDLFSNTKYLAVDGVLNITLDGRQGTILSNM